MKKHIFGKKLGRDKDERKALFKSLMSSLVLSDKIQTTEAKAKAIRPEIEKLVTKAKKGTNSAKRVLEKSLTADAFEKIIKEIAPSFENKQGGYTRLIKLGKRLGDNTSVVIIEWTEVIKRTPISIEEKPSKQVKTPVKKEIAKKPVKKVKSVKKTTKK